MGLLQNITSGVYKTPDEHTSKSGLLSKVSHLDLTESISFHDFICNHNITYFAVLEKINNYYFISNSFGFDSKSIISSYSTSDFWNGILQSTDSIYNFYSSDNTLNPLLQLFSFELKEFINHIVIYNSTDNKIYLCCSNTEISNINSLKNHISLISFQSIYASSNINSNEAIITIDFKDALNDYINKNIKNIINMRDSFIDTLVHEIKNRMYFYFYNDIKYLCYKDSSIFIYLDKDLSISKEIITKHLSFCFLDIFETENYKIKYL